MSRYVPAHSSVLALVATLIAANHPDLLTVEVRIDVLMVHPPTDNEGQPTGPALKHQGYEAAGLAKIVSLKDRAKGMGDGEIQIDAEWWAQHDDERLALLDHELQHFAVGRDRYNVFGYDDQHRPKLKMRLHDHQFGWFDVIAARHGRAATEVRQAKALMDHAGQLYWPDMGTGGTGNLEVRNVAQAFVDSIRKAGTKVTITGAGQSVTIE